MVISSSSSPQWRQLPHNSLVVRAPVFFFFFWPAGEIRRIQSRLIWRITGPYSVWFPHNGSRSDSRNRLSSIRIVSASNIPLLLLSSLSKPHRLVSGEPARIPSIKEEDGRRRKNRRSPSPEGKKKGSSRAGYRRWLRSSNASTYHLGRICIILGRALFIFLQLSLFSLQPSSAYYQGPAGSILLPIPSTFFSFSFFYKSPSLGVISGHLFQFGFK